MKKVLLIVLNIIMLTICFQALCQKQTNTVCNYINAKQSTRLVSVDDLHVRVAKPGTLCVNIKLHKITKSGIPSIPDEQIEATLVSLNSSFSSSGNAYINFITDSDVQEHNFDDVFTSNPIVFDDEGNLTADFNTIIDIDAIDDPFSLDLYFSNQDLGGTSFSYGIAYRSIAFIADWNIGTSVVQHEVGHTLGLFHTYHGTIGYGSNGNPAVPENYDIVFDTYLGHEAECPDNSNPNSGDYVLDTITDLGPGTYNFSANNPCADPQVDETAVQICNQEIPVPDVSNYMRGSTSNNIDLSICWNHFTDGQIFRMLYYLAESDLSQITRDCPPPPCDTCFNDDSNNPDEPDYDPAANIIHSNFQWIEECTSAILIHPGLLPTSCTQSYRIEWDNQSVIFDSSFTEDNPLIMNFNGDNNTYNIIIQRENIDCDNIYELECSADDDTCDNCNTISSVFVIENPTVGDIPPNCRDRELRPNPDIDFCPEWESLWTIIPPFGGDVTTSESTNYTYTFIEDGEYTIIHKVSYRDEDGNLICSAQSSQTYTPECNECMQIECPDIALTKSAVGFSEPNIPITYNPGDTVTYKIAVKNNEDVDTCPTSFSIIDPLNTIVFNTSLFNNINENPNISLNDSEVIIDVIELNPGESRNYFFSIVISDNPDTDEVTNCAVIEMPNCKPISACTSNPINSCEDCGEVGAEILGSLDYTEECGDITFEVPLDILDCYRVYFNSGIEGDTDIEIIEENIFNGIFTFTGYTNNVGASPSIRLVSLETGKDCFWNKRAVNFDCFCDDCNANLAEELYDLIEEDSTVCGDYSINIPAGLDCYKIVANFDDGNGDIELVEGINTFHYDENGSYDVFIEVVNLEIGTGILCSSYEDVLEVNAYYEDPNCGDWPKTFGNNSNFNTDDYQAEYVSDMVVDSQGKLIALGRASSGDIDGNNHLNGPSYLIKYSSDGCTVEEFMTLPWNQVQYPLELKITEDDELIIFSQMHPNHSSGNTYNLYKLDSEWNELWSSHVDSTLGEHFSMTLNEHTGDIYLLASFKVGLTTPNAKIEVIDSANNVQEFENKTILRFNTSGVLDWFEEISFSNTNGSNPLKDIDFDEANNRLFIAGQGRDDSTISLLNSNIEFDIANNPESFNNNFYYYYDLNEFNIPVFQSNFNPNSDLSDNAINDTKIISDGNYFYTVLKSANFVTHIEVFNTNGNYLDYIGYWIGEGLPPQLAVTELQHKTGTNYILVTGKNNPNQGGFSWTKIIGTTPVGGVRHLATPGDRAEGLGIIENNNQEIFVGGYFSGGISQLDYVGGFDGFIYKYIDNCGEIEVADSLTNGDSDIDKKIIIFPNPFIDSFNIKNLTKHKIKNIEIRNLSGLLLYDKPYSKDETIKFNPKETGIYFIKLYFDNGGAHIKTIIKSK